VHAPAYRHELLFEEPGLPAEFGDLVLVLTLPLLELSLVDGTDLQIWSSRTLYRPVCQPVFNQSIRVSVGRAHIGLKPRQQCG
jgi:hypothetical protein